MKRELDYFYIGESFGGNQDWCRDPMMHLGGCAALTACDICIYIARKKGLTHLYPFDAYQITKKDYLRFSKGMKPYLRPRSHGVNRTDLYTDGFRHYLTDIGDTQIILDEFDGTVNVLDAWETIKSHIDDELPVAYLMLKHQDKSLADFVWHWFLLVGYKEIGEDNLCSKEQNVPKRMVKTATYGECLWLDFDNLWKTGFDEKGGMVLVEIR